MPAIMKTPKVVRANGDQKREMTTYGWFMFNRTGAQIPYKGELARDFLTVMTTDPNVVRISKRVDVLQWDNGKDWLEHAPRYAVHTRGPDGQPSVLLADVEWSWTENLEARTKSLLKDARTKNLSYVVFTEENIRIQPRLINAKLIGRQAARDNVDHSVVEAVDRFARTVPFVSVENVMSAGIAPYEDAYRAVLHMVAHGRLRFPLSRQQFGPRTRVHRRSRRA